MKHFEKHLTTYQYAKSTIGEYVRSIREFISYCKKENLLEETLSYNDLTGYVQHLQKKDVTPGSINNRVNALKQYFKYLQKQKKRADNPASEIHLRRVKKDSIIKVLSEEQLSGIYKTFVGDSSTHFNAKDSTHLKRTVLLGLVIYQGLSSKDLKKLLVTDFNLLEGTVYVSGESERILKLQAPQMLSLQRYIDKIKIEKFFTSIVDNDLHYIFCKLNRAYTMQQLRQSRIMLWVKQYNIRTVQYMGGFKYLSSLKRYQQQNLEGLKQQVERFHPLG